MAISEVISQTALETLWAANQMDAKREAGTLTDLVADEARASNPAYAGATSRIVKLLTASGQHIGTIHEIVDGEGKVLHSHPKDYTRRDCSRVRSGTERQQAPR